MNNLLNFARRFFIFLTPVLLCMAVYEYAMYKTGDSWPVALVAHKQQRISEILYGRKLFSHDFFHYKKRVMENSKAGIVVLGSSRVMQIRASMFSPLDDTFYNLGGMVRNVFELQTYCNLIVSGKVHKPRVLIVGIDPWWFNKQRSRTDRNHDWRGFDWLPNLSDHCKIGLDFIRGTKIIPYDAIKQGLGSESPYYGYYSIGLSAILEGSGFRSDGSRQYSPQIVFDFLRNPVYVDRESPPIITRVKNNQNFLTPPYFEFLDVLVTALEKVQKSGVEVYAILPAFSSEVVDEFTQSKLFKEAWKIYREKLPRRLEGINVNCLLGVSPDTFGLNDKYMFDGMHPSEVLMGHQMLELFKNVPTGSYLRKVDVEKVEKMIKNPEGNALSFDIMAFQGSKGVIEDIY